MACSTIEVIMCLSEVKGGVLWKWGEVREDVGGEVGGIGRGKVPFAKRGKAGEVTEQVRDRAGGGEGESKEIVTRGRENVEGDGGVANLRP